MIQTIRQDAETRMNKSVESMLGEFSKIRTGRANTALLDHIKVDYYGTLTPIAQVANVSVADARTLSVAPWEKSMIPVLEKSILESDLGLNPVTSDDVIRIPIPALTEERRRELGKMARAEGENGKIAVRNIRRDALHSLKELLKEKEISEDEEKRAHDDIQTLTNSIVERIDKLVGEKEQEIMEV